MIYSVDKLVKIRIQLMMILKTVCIIYNPKVSIIIIIIELAALAGEEFNIDNNIYAPSVPVHPIDMRNSTRVRIYYL